MPRLNEHSRHKAIGMLRAGASVRQVAGAFGVHYSTVYRLQQRLQVTGTVADRPRAGASRVTTPRQDRAIRLQHLQDRFQTAASTGVPSVVGPCEDGSQMPTSDVGDHTAALSSQTVIVERGGSGLPTEASWVVARLGGTSCSPTNPDFVSVIKMAESECTEGQGSATGMAVYCKETVMAEHQSWSGGLVS